MRYFASGTRFEDLRHEGNDVQQFLRAGVIRLDDQRFHFQVRGENGLVLRNGDDSQPMSEILQQCSIGNVVHLFVTDEQNLRERCTADAEQRVLDLL